MRGKWSRLALGLLMVAFLTGAAVVLGVVANGHSSSARGEEVVAKGGDPDAKGKTSAQDSASVEKGPASVTAAEEAYAERAYPAEDVPIELTLNAQKAWAKVKGKSAVSNGGAGGAVWTLVGPSQAQAPSLLTFSGAQYVASGRITAIAIDPACSQASCRVWIGAAGGGVWRTTNGLAPAPTWTSVSDGPNGLPTDAIGTLTYDASSNTLYAGTGEPNAAVDNEAGLGLFKSTDGGDTWSHLDALTTTTISGTWTNKDAFLNRAINAVVVDPTNSNTIYVGTASAVRGVSSVLSGGVAGAPTPLPARGVYKSTDGGATFTLLNSSTSGLPFALRGVTDVKLDPNNPNIIYAGQFGQGVFRSTDGGTSWTQIFAPINAANTSVIERYSLAPTTLPNGKTRIYMGVGDNGTFSARLYRTDDATATTPAFTNITTTQDSGYCGSQCWYDNVVYSPAGQPDTVYLGGSYDYGNSGTPALNTTGRTNGRAFLYSTDAGAHFTDLTRDSSSATAPNGMHPDEHAIAVSPTNPNIAFFGSDGGLVRDSGSFADISSQCDSRDLTVKDKDGNVDTAATAANVALCKQLLSRVPTVLYSLNKGLSTLQFQSLSANPTDSKSLMGGTQDNGTWGYGGSPVAWPQLIWGDGGQSGFNAANPALRFNTFTGQANDANFQNGDPAKWVVISGDILSSPESAQFYPPVISDPNAASAGSIFQGSQSIWRTQDWGGDQSFLEANCSEFGPNGVDHSADPNCGDFVKIGPAGATTLTGTAATADYRGTTRGGGNVAAIERAASDTSTLWAATTTGRVFISKNANAAAASVTYTRLDTLSAAAPNRFVSGIFIDPSNPNHAWLSYSGFNATTTATPGHVFEVTYDPTAGTATWTSLDGSGETAFPDIPATDVVRDSNGDLYVSNDFGVMKLPSGSSDWQVAGANLPNVEVAGLTIIPGAHKLYAATHGRGAWLLSLS